MIVSEMKYSELPKNAQINFLAPIELKEELERRAKAENRKLGPWLLLYLDRTLALEETIGEPQSFGTLLKRLDDIEARFDAVEAAETPAPYPRKKPPSPSEPEITGRKTSTPRKKKA